MVSPAPHILPLCRVKATFTQCPVQETIRGVVWRAEARKLGRRGGRGSLTQEIIPAHSRCLGYGTYKVYPLPHFTLDVRPG